MRSRDFVYWLQGFFELSKNVTLSAEKVDMIKRHLAMVFKAEIDPAFGDSLLQEQLQQIHHVVTDDVRFNC